MTCSACGKQNLPGGVRCIYCGLPFPADFDFDIGAAAPRAAAPALDPSSGPAGPAGGSTRARGGCIATLGLLALKAKSLLGLLKLGKIATTLFSMAVFIWVDAQLFGWKFGAGIGICILIHEMGHVLANRRNGIKSSAPIFIPGLGALIYVRRFPNNPLIESECGAGGPIGGLLAACVCLGVAFGLRSPFWLALAHVGFAINLFNLLPISPLDGSRIGSVFSPRVWKGVIIVLVLVAIKTSFSVLWLLAVVGLLAHFTDHEHGRYLLARPRERLRMAVVYVGLAVILSGGMYLSAHTHWKYDNVQLSATDARMVRRWTSDSEAAPMPIQRPPMPMEKQWRIASTVHLGLLPVALLMWGGIVLLLGKAHSARPGARPGILLALGLAPEIVGAGLVLAHLLPPAIALRWAAGYAGASVSAMIFAGYAAAKARPWLPTAPWQALVCRCLAWAVLTALLLAYALPSLSVALLSLVGTAIFYAVWPWAWSSMLARQWKEAGDTERSRRYLLMALKRPMAPETASALWRELAAIELANECGAAALEALDRKQAADAARQAPAWPAISDLAARSTAMGLLGRYDEALACCEAILAAPQMDLGSANRLNIAMICVARLAQMRGWSDEADVRYRELLGHIPRSGGLFAAGLLVEWAAVLVSMGQGKKALQACERSTQFARHPLLEGHLALVRARAALAQGDLAAADEEARMALRTAPDSLSARECCAAVLAAGVDRERGAAELRALANEYAAEYWGRRAAQRLEELQATPATA